MSVATGDPNPALSDLSSKSSLYYHRCYLTYITSAVVEYINLKYFISHSPCHGAHWKRHVQQSSYYWVGIRYGGNVSTEPLPSNDRGIFTEPLPYNDRGIHIKTQRLMEGIFQLGRWNGLRCRDIRTKFHKYWFRHSTVHGGGDTHTDSNVISYAYSILAYFPILKKKLSMIMRSCCCPCVCVCACC
jgi:hypothetical protein